MNWYLLPSGLFSISYPKLRTGIAYILALIFLVAVTVYLSAVIRHTHNREMQLVTTQELATISAKLQGIVTNNLSLISGLAAHIAINPSIEDAEFQQYVEAVFRQEPLLINMAAAPDLVIKMIYPYEENKTALGLDYRDLPEQWDAVNRARVSRKLVIAGPLELVQGGMAFIGRKAVYTRDGDFWGLVSAPLDAEALYRLAGLSDESRNIVVSIRGKDGMGQEGAVFYGDPAIFEDDRASKLEIEFDDGKWQLAARPKEGWDSTPESIWGLRIVFGILFIFLNLITFYVVRQIRSEQKYQRILQHQAVYDQLTDLPNRFLFEDRLEKLIVKADRDNRQLAILFIDLDNFKPVNDNLGHKAGDLLLRQVAQRIKGCIRESDTAARYSGDEFVIIVQDVEDVNGPATVSTNILGAIAKPYSLGDNQVFCTASIGIAMYPDDAKTMEQLISKADQAMYQAKNSGRNKFQYFTKTMQIQSENRHHLYNRLVRAVVHKTLEVHYQPIVNLHDGTFHKCEALVRWYEGIEQINTADFISLAEETGMINEIDAFVLETATEFLMTQSQKLNCRLGLSVNLSPRLFTASDDSLKNWIAIVSVAIKVIDITVEITERLLTEESSGVFEILLELKEMGVSIAIDDFGTGYSSLSYLIKFPIDIIKIDRAFISQLGVDKKSDALTEAIIGMCKKMSLQVVAEGVETDRQLVHLEQWNCDYCQGYYFSKPLSGDDFINFLTDDRIKGA